MNQADILKATEPVVNAFEFLSIAYYIGGSVASSSYGMAHATIDVDIVADIKAHHVRPLFKRLEQNLDRHSP